MDKDEIIRMAREAGFDSDYFDNVECSCDECNFLKKPLERFANLVASHEKKFWMEQIEVECNEAVLAERDKALEAARTVGGEFFVEFEKVYLK